MPRHRLAEVTPVGVEGRHLRLRAVAGDGRAVEGIAFRASGKKLGEALIRLKGAPVHLAGTLSVNRFGGRERAQIRVVDVAEATPVIARPPCPNVRFEPLRGEHNLRASSHFK